MSSYKKEALAVEAAKYLVQLYMSTTYMCNRQKLQKLILFAHFSLLLDSQEGLISGEKITASYMGLGIDSVSKEYRTFEVNSVNESKKILPSDLIERKNTDFTSNYQYNEEQLQSNKKILKDFFFEFGAYDKDDLSNVTKELELYPKDSPELLKGNTIFLDYDAVTGYINSLKKREEYKNCQGFEIIKKEIQNKLDKIAKQKEK